MDGKERLDVGNIFVIMIYVVKVIGCKKIKLEVWRIYF